MEYFISVARLVCRMRPDLGFISFLPLRIKFAATSPALPFALGVGHNRSKPFDENFLCIGVFLAKCYRIKSFRFKGQREATNSREQIEDGWFHSLQAKSQFLKSTIHRPEPSSRE